MHFHFTAVEVTWTLTFAALLVLLVVLLGRDRVARFPFFTAGIVMVGLEMLSRRLLADKLAPLTSTELFLTLADIGVAVGLLVAIELARRAFPGASRRAWIAGAVVVLAAAGGILAWWGPWPARETLGAHSLLAHLRLMQLVAEKGDLFNNLLVVELTLIAIFTGRRFHTGWRAHPRQILLGFSVVALVQVAVRLVWQRLSSAGPPRDQAEFNHRITFQTRLLDLNSIAYLVVLVFWVVCLWFDDPGYAPAAPAVAALDAAVTPPEESPASADKTDAVAAALERAIGPDSGKPPRRP
jgi:hypothetical protein